MRRSNAPPRAIDPGAAAATTTTKMDSSALPQLQSFLLSQIPSSIPKLSRSSGGGVCVLAAASPALAVFLYLLVASRGWTPPEFAIIIDGGSTGSRIHVFGYRIGWGGVPQLDLDRTASMKVNPGLSAYAEEPSRAGESLLGLLEFARGMVPRDRWGETEVRLMATAGLRLVEAGVVERILESCRKVLKASRFRFQDQWASVISGTDEGIYGWVAANYALGALGGDPQKTTGILELGGASAQVTFVTSEHLPSEFSQVLKLGDATYNLYSNSFLHLGQNVAYESLHELLSSRHLKSKSLQEVIYRDPCSPRGFLHSMRSLKLSAGVRFTAYAVGNFSECRSAALALLQKGKEKCVYHHCPLGSSFVPKLQGRFLATENFFYTSKFFGLGPTSFLSDLLLAGERFCNEDWLKHKKRHHSLDEEELLLYCFSSAYIVALLHDSLGIALDDKRIDFANEVGGVPLDWALGAFVMQKALNPSFSYSDWITDAIGVTVNPSTVLSNFIIPAFLALTAWSILKWKKPLSETMFYWEKWRYVITRVDR
uniref:Apyrase 6 n=1 Tax=Ananas comosus var. bracteatus TaxID=296719 RepID=A0A6V7P2X0_ANACO|nr:unnamed protein product [Ananas comosus var. bracteatus]